MDVEIAFSGFLLQNVFIPVRICFIGHTIVRPTFISLTTLQPHLNTGEVSFLVKYTIISKIKALNKINGE